MDCEDPPEPPSAAEQPTPDLMDQTHRALLETARPFSRVDTRPHDPDLRQRLVEATAYAATLAPAATNWPIGLQATTALAAAVAGNAMPADLMTLIESDRERRPLCVATPLLRELAILATERGHHVVAARARTDAIELFRETDWADEQTWSGSEVYGAAMLDCFATAGSPKAVRESLASALRNRPGVATTMLRSCASWVERRDSWRMHQHGVAVRTYDDLPPWLPAVELLKTLSSSRGGPSTTGTADEEIAGLARELAERLQAERPSSSLR